jgi:hypothetical protein
MISFKSKLTRQRSAIRKRNANSAAASLFAKGASLAATAPITKLQDSKRILQLQFAN